MNSLIELIEDISIPDEADIIINLGFAREIKEELDYIKDLIKKFEKSMCNHGEFVIIDENFNCPRCKILDEMYRYAHGRLK